MNWDQIEGNGKIYRGKIKERWGKLTDRDLDVIAGKYDQLIGHVQKTYGIVREEAERQIEDFMRKNALESAVEAIPPKHRDETGEDWMDTDYGRDKKAS